MSCRQSGPPIGPAPEHTHCCSECAAASRLGDTPAPDPSTGVWVSLLVMVGGFVLAGAASGKFKGMR